MGREVRRSLLRGAAEECDTADDRRNGLERQSAAWLWREGMEGDAVRRAASTVASDSGSVLLFGATGRIDRAVL